MSDQSWVDTAYPFQEAPQHYYDPQEASISQAPEKSWLERIGDIVAPQITRWATGGVHPDNESWGQKALPEVLSMLPFGMTTGVAKAGELAAGPLSQAAGTFARTAENLLATRALTPSRWNVLRGVGIGDLLRSDIASGPRWADRSVPTVMRELPNARATASQIANVNASGTIRGFNVGDKGIIGMQEGIPKPEQTLSHEMTHYGGYQYPDQEAVGNAYTDFAMSNPIAVSYLQKRYPNSSLEGLGNELLAWVNSGRLKGDRVIPEQSAPILDWIVDWADRNTPHAALQDAKPLPIESALSGLLPLLNQAKGQ